MQISQRLVLDHYAEILNVSAIEWTHYTCMRSSLVRPSDHVDESKSTRLLGFRLMFVENVRAFRSESKMENQVAEFGQSNFCLELLSCSNVRGGFSELTSFSFLSCPSGYICLSSFPL